MQASAKNRPANPGLTLLPKPAHKSPLALWHLLSLDAPTIATLWITFIARTNHIHLPWQAPTAMFLAVWMLYAVDRLLDARHLTDLEERHRFHHRHRRIFLTIIPAVSIALAVLIPALYPAALHLYAILASLLFAYFFIIHISTGRRLPKELAVGLFFPAAIFIPTIARAPQLRLTLLPAALLFAATCTLNCLYLYRWEHEKPAASAHWTTSFATRHLQPITLAILAITITTWALIPSGNRPIAAACTLSIAILFMLNATRKSLSALHVRAAADLALLTPVLLIPFTR